MVGNLCSFVASHLGELLTFAVSLGAIVTSWMCIKRGMNAEVEKALILRKVEIVEQAFVSLEMTIEIEEQARAFLLGDFKSKQEQGVALCECLQKLQDLRLNEAQFGSKMLQAAFYFNLVKFREISSIMASIRDVTLLLKDLNENPETQDSQKSLIMCIEKIRKILEEDLEHWRTIRTKIRAEIRKDRRLKGLFHGVVDENMKL